MIVTYKIKLPAGVFEGKGILIPLRLIINDMKALTLTVSKTNLGSRQYLRIRRRADHRHIELTSFDVLLGKPLTAETLGTFLKLFMHTADIRYHRPLINTAGCG